MHWNKICIEVTFSFCAAKHNIGANNKWRCNWLLVEIGVRNSTFWRQRTQFVPDVPNGGLLCFMQFSAAMCCSQWVADRVHLFILFGASGQHPRVNWSCGGGGMQVALVEIMAEALSDFSRDIPSVRLSFSHSPRTVSRQLLCFQQDVVGCTKRMCLALFCEAWLFYDWSRFNAVISRCPMNSAAAHRCYLFSYIFRFVRFKVRVRVLSLSDFVRTARGEVFINNREVKGARKGYSASSET